MATATCSALLAAALLCNALTGPAPITLHGTPISGTVEVYRLAAPTVAPGAEQDAESEQPSSERPIRRNALWGAVIGCSAGAVYSKRGNDDAHAFNCLWVAGLGAAFGAIASL